MNISSLMLVSVIAISALDQVMLWGDLASIKSELIEDKARKFLLPENLNYLNQLLKHFDLSYKQALSED